MAENLQLSEKKEYASLRDDQHLAYISQMPLAVANGGRPINYAEVMINRVFTSGEVQGNWRFNCIDTGDGCEIHSDESFVVVLDDPRLRVVNSQTVLNERGALLVDESYSVKGVKFSKRDREIFTGKYQIEKQAKENKVLFELARQNQSLLDQTVEAAFKYLKDTYDVIEGMAVILPDAWDVSELRAWGAGRFCSSGYYGRSSARGDCSRDNVGYARLVRVGA